ncbi:DUF438 domain-containing protein [Mesoterricola silvestris]|uniref:DUF438 domain-containing protein n=1 Tax=Mesoterricola silvestris TaxID=2927979 RepID=A0AA48GIL9_9BACT|nr:DUF438 domain-containing protein [Mesoterricola silvestris]BDU71709.1 hypothetical protein METEAL_08830 [Mesoterricola silvestris]
MSELINNQELRIKTLKEVILHLHAGEAPEAVRERLKGIVSEVDANEIAAMEQQLMAEGLSPEQVRSMCDLHADVLKDVMAKPSAPPALLPGHPVDTFQRENRALEQAADLARRRAAACAALPDSGTPAAERLALLEALAPLMDVEKHYSRKEHLVFTILERHGNTGPSKVMWGKDDEVRAQLKGAMAGLREETLCGAELKILAASAVAPALDALESMIYKEEKILFPMALHLFTEEEWGEVFSQSQAYGWCLVAPAEGWRPPESTLPQDPLHLPAAKAVQFPSGTLSFEQLLGIFNALPVDLTFVDAQDRVGFFSEGPERIFARSRAIIGRDVQNCHPPKSMAIVEKILADFREGRQSVAEFWIQMGGKFVHIRYFAVRNEAGEYLGTLEVTQELSRLRALSGERRLLQYDETVEAL